MRRACLMLLPAFWRCHGIPLYCALCPGRHDSYAGASASPVAGTVLPLAEIGICRDEVVDAVQMLHLIKVEGKSGMHQKFNPDRDLN